MKFMKKINLGLILAIITIIAITIYSICIYSQRSSEKEEIKKVCEDYISLVNKYSVLPERYQTIGESKKDIDLTQYYEEMKNEVSKYAKNGTTAELEFAQLKNNLEEEQLNTSKVKIQVDREISKISSYDFDGNQVVVTFNQKVTVKQKYMQPDISAENISEKINENVYESKGNMITLEKVDGSWKVVSSSLSYAEISNYANMM